MQANNACSYNQRGLVFNVSSCGYRLASNPAQSDLTVEFERPDRMESLPDAIELKSEKTGQTVRSVDIKTRNQKGEPMNRITLDVANLPRGVYYLHLTFPDRREEKVDKVRILLN